MQRDEPILSMICLNGSKPESLKCIKHNLVFTDIIFHPFFPPIGSLFWDMGVSKNNGTPKSSILIGFSITNHPFWGIPIFGNTHI